MKKLYQILDSLEELFDIMQGAETEEDYSEALANFENMKLELDDKLENCCAFVKNLRAESAAFSAEAKRLAEHAKRQSDKVEKIERYLSGLIPAGNNWARGVHKIGWRKSDAVIVDDIDLLPKEFIRTKIITEPEKTKIKDKELIENLKSEIKNFKIKEEYKKKDSSLD